MVTDAGTPTRGSWRRWCLRLLLVVAAVGVFTACEPPPPNGSDLGIVVTDAPGEFAPGEGVTVTATITNHGTATATAVYLYYGAPDSVAVDGLTGSTVGDCATHSATLGACALTDLAPDEQHTVEVAVTGVNEAATADLTLWVNSENTEPDPDPNPNTVTVPLTVGTGGLVDLEVTAEAPDGIAEGVAPPDTLFTSRTWVTNRGPSAASGVVVSKEISGDVTILDTRLQRALPGGGVKTGSCTVDIDPIAGQHTVTCTTDGALVAPTTTPAHRWVLEVDATGGVTNPNGTAAVELVHTVSSPHPEPDPDPSPNTITSTIAISHGFLFDPVPPVPAGTIFDIEGVLTGAGEESGGTIWPYLIDVTTPANIEPISVTIDGQTVPCPTGSCEQGNWELIGAGTPVSMKLQAVETGPRGWVRLRTISLPLNPSFAQGNGFALVQVIDPSITSEIHPTLDPIDDTPVGDSIDITGTVHNTGSIDHPDVTATIAVPANLEVNDVRWGIADLPCPVTGSTATCSLGTVPAHTQIPISMTATPTGPGTTTVTMTTTSTLPQDDPDPYPDTTDTTFEALLEVVDLGVELTSTTPDPAYAGATWSATSTITNHGTVPATGVQFAATVPDGVTITGATIPTIPLRPPDAGSCSIDGQEVTCPVGTIPAGASVRIITSTGTGLLPELSGTVELAVTSDHTEPDPDPHPNTISWELVGLPASADLSTWLEPAPSVVFAGQARTLRHRLRNNGPSATAGVVSTFEVPAGWTITSVESGGWMPCTVTGATVTCEALGTFWGSSVHTIDVTVIPDQVTDEAVVTGSISSGTPDPDPSNNAWSHTLRVDPLEFDLGIAATYDAAPLAGSARNIDFQITNTGPAPAEGLVFTATLPESTQLNSIPLAAGFSCDTEDQTLTCTRPTMQPGTSTMRLRVTALVPGESTITASLSSAVPEVPDVLPNSVDVTRTAVVVPGRITGTVTDPNGGLQQWGNVRLYRVGEDSAMATATLNASFASRGTYRFDDIEPGDYQVLVVPAITSGLRSEWFDGQVFRADATTLTVVGIGDQIVADAALEPQPPTTVSGQITDGEGQPVGGVVVGAYRDSDVFVPSHQITTGPDGTYSLTIPVSNVGYPFPAEAYKIRFGPPAGSGLVTQWYDNQPTRAAATPWTPTHWGQAITAHVTLAAAP